MLNIKKGKKIKLKIHKIKDLKIKLNCLRNNHAYIKVVQSPRLHSKIKSKMYLVEYVVLKVTRLPNMSFSLKRKEKRRKD